MPKDRKKTYSDHQSEASRQKRVAQEKKPAPATNPPAPAPARKPTEPSR